MERNYLGDALDYYKRWFLQEACKDLLRELRVIPMSAQELGQDDRRTYAALLGVPLESLILTNAVPNCRHRNGYFIPAREHPRSDFFADPNTGLRLGNKPQRRSYSDYLFDHDVRLLLPEHSDRLLVVYDQSISRGCEIECVLSKITMLRKEFLAVAYCAQAAMLVLGRPEARSRLKDIRNRLQRLDYVRRDRVVSNFE